MGTQPPEQPAPAPPRRPSAGLGIAALVLAIPSCFCWLGAPVAFILGLGAYLLAVRNPVAWGGRRASVAAMVLSGIASAMLLLVGLPYQGIDTIRFRPIWESDRHGNESSAIGDLRTLVSAEAGYSVQNGGFFDTPECLVKPATCLPKPQPGSFLTEAYLRAERKGYRFTFHPGPGPAAAEIAAAQASPSSLKDYAYAAVPQRPGATGSRSFCIDSNPSPRVCMYNDGAPPPVSDGRCQACTVAAP